MKNADRLARTRQIILDAYMDIAEREGMSKVTVTKICEAADISRPTFYNHYDSPEALLNEAFQELYRRIDSEAVQRIIYEPDDQFICEYAGYYKRFSPMLKKLLNGKSPEFDYYLQCKLFQNIPKPKNYDFDYEAQVAYDLINAVQYTIIKLVIFHPEIPDEDILKIYKKTTEDFAAKKYLSSI